MRFRSAISLATAALSLWGIVYAQRPFKQYRAEEYEGYPLPPDWNQKTEWTQGPASLSQRLRQFTGDQDLNWTIDYPRSDRHLLQGIRRLTRIDARSV